MITMQHRLLTLGAAAMAAVTLTAATASATTIYFDDGANFTNMNATLGTTETFQFQDVRWDHDVITPCESNTMALLIAVDNAQNGGNGLSAHVEYPFTGAGAAHGPLVPGNVIRLSAWVAIDPGAVLNTQDFQFALLKIEFYEDALTANFIYDTDRTDGLFTSYANQLSSTNWTQFVYEYEYDPTDFSTAALSEIRGVVVQGDYTKGITGNVVVDNVRMEIFADATAAAASAVDTTNPGCLPAPFVFFDINMDQALVDSTVVEWDGQLGVQYLFQYSDDSGTTWSNATSAMTGTGGRMQATDPAGVVTGRTYRVVTPPAVPRVPGS